VFLMKVNTGVPEGWLLRVYLMKVITNVPDEGYYECT
jgi:hypothetical protein